MRFRFRSAVSTWWAFAAALLVVDGLQAAQSGSLELAVQSDWALQEGRLGRTADSPEAIRAALQRAGRLLGDLVRLRPAVDLAAELRDLERLGREARGVGSLDRDQRLRLYQRIRWVARQAALKNPLLAGRPILFLQRRRFISQMLHEYLGYFYDYGDLAGGGVYLLEEPGHSLKTRDLIRGRLPRGNYTTLALSYDARTIYFAFCERAPKKPDFYSPQRRCFHLFAMDADGGKLRQLTFGPDDDFDPCPLPDGGLAFLSTRRGGFGRCHNPWEPLPAYTLHRLDLATGQVERLSHHETNEWHPSVLADGRIAYIRWDYVDRSAANYHGIWVTNPDGTAAQILFGNYTEQINACYQPRAIPGSRRVVFVAGAHHAVVGGSLVLVDPAATSLDPKTGHDRLDAIERLTPEVCFPEAAGWPDSFFHSPWPLSENYYLVAFSFRPLPGMGPGVQDDNPTGLYYFDRFGNLELLYRQEGISSMYPIPVAPRPVPPVIPSTLDAQMGDEGELVLSDVQNSLMPLPANRRITSLRIFQVLPKTETHVANQPRIGYANAESARMLLGSVPVEPDGSAWFRVPARKPLYFQAVDAAGRAVQTMRSIVYVQPGERRGCVGCHEWPGTAPPQRPLMATRRPASPITPGPDGTRPMSFVRLVQPVLDRHCVRCHDGTPGARSRLVLRGEPAGSFSRSYENLKRFVRWYEWGGASIHQVVTLPGQGGADQSPLLAVLEDKDHRGQVHMADEDHQRLALWLDANAPFYGTYSQPEQAAQRRGQAVTPPRIQ
ncbi:MAG: HzsA-related protein [Thermoguttaceae bacterium]